MVISTFSELHVCEHFQITSSMSYRLKSIKDAEVFVQTWLDRLQLSWNELLDHFKEVKIHFENDIEALAAKAFNCHINPYNPHRYDVSIDIINVITSVGVSIPQLNEVLQVFQLQSSLKKYFFSFLRKDVQCVFWKILFFCSKNIFSTIIQTKLTRNILLKVTNELSY